jgi:hypothetical protein
MSEDADTLIWCAVWVAVNALIGFGLGKLRGQTGSAVALAVLLGPLGWLLIFCLHDARPKCPECGGVVVPNARKCRHCGSGLIVCLGPAK